MYKKLALSSLFVTSLLALTACGGNTNTSSINNENTTHPAFSWAKVAVSNNYSPSGDTTDLTPTFSWKALKNTTVYNLGHQNTDGSGRWVEYTVPAAAASCATTPTCNYKPANIIFNVGEQKVWWVRGKANGQWTKWSDAHVFNLVSGNTGTDPTTPSPQSPRGTIRELSPVFTWKPVSTAQSYVMGIENKDGSEWQSFTLDASKNCSTALCKYQPNKVLVNSNYTWWVRAELKTAKWTNWSNGANFIVNADNNNSALKALQPIGTIKTTKPTFSWTPVSSASHYQIGFDSNGLWKEYTVARCAINCSYTPLNSGIKSGDSITWYIRAMINGDWQQWSNGTDFTVNRTSIKRPFIIKVDTKRINRSRARPPYQFHIDTKQGYDYNFNVDCNNDGVLEATNQQGKVICEYATRDTFEVAISGNYPAPFFHNERPGGRYDSKAIVEIKQWGSQVWENLAGSFSGSIANITASDTPDLSKVTSLRHIFSRSHVSGDISKWDISNIQDMSLWMWGNSRVFSGFSTVEYDRMLINWSKLNLKSVDKLGKRIYFHAGLSRYSPASAAARQKIIDKFNWVIKDAGSSTVPPNPAKDIIKVRSGLQQVTFTWLESTIDMTLNKQIKGYYIYRNNKLIATKGKYSPDRTFTDTTIKAGLTYKYRVQAFDTAGNVSKNDPTLTATIPMTVDTQAPTIPANLQQHHFWKGKEIEWDSSTDNDGVKAYKIFRDGTFIQTSEHMSTIRKHSSWGLGLPKGRHTYKVIAVDYAGNESAPASVTFTIP